MALRSRQGLQRGWRGRVCGSERIASTAGAYCVVRLETIEMDRRGEHLLGGRLYFSSGRALVEELLNKK